MYLEEIDEVIGVFGVVGDGGNAQSRRHGLRILRLHGGDHRRERHVGVRLRLIGDDMQGQLRPDSVVQLVYEHQNRAGHA